MAIFHNDHREKDQHMEKAKSVMPTIGRPGFSAGLDMTRSEIQQLHELIAKLEALISSLMRPDTQPIENYLPCPFESPAVSEIFEQAMNARRAKERLAGILERLEL